MSATLRLREASDETAELQDLLSRLRTPEEGGEIVGGFVDGWHRTINYLHGINRKNILETCNKICEVQKDSIAKLNDETEKTLHEFMEELNITPDKKQEKANINKLSAIWKTLKPEMILYRDTTRHTKVDAAETITNIEALLKKMAEFEKGWPDEFPKK